MKRGTVREDGMILLRTKKGVQIWGNQEQWNNAEKWRLNYMEKRRNMYRNSEVKKWKIGDLNPENGKYYIRNSGNYTPIWGTIDDVIKYQKQKRDMKVKYLEKMKQQKRLVAIENKRRRGDIDPILNLIFFKYNSLTGSEIWYNKEKFETIMEKERKKRKERRITNVIQ